MESCVLPRLFQPPILFVRVEPHRALGCSEEVMSNQQGAGQGIQTQDQETPDTPLGSVGASHGFSLERCFVDTLSIFESALVTRPRSSSSWPFESSFTLRHLTAKR